MPHDWILTLACSPLTYVLVLALVTLDGLFPPVPSETTVIALAAVAVATGHPNLVLVLGVAAAGAFAGDQLAYAVGRHLRPCRLSRLDKSRWDLLLDRAGHTLAHRGPAVLLAARYVPVGRVVVNLAAGATGYPRRRFTAVTAVGAVTWSLYTVVIGVVAGAWFHGQPVLAMLVGVVLGIVVGLALERQLPASVTGPATAPSTGPATGPATSHFPPRVRMIMPTPRTTMKPARPAHTPPMPQPKCSAARLSGA